MKRLPVLFAVQVVLLAVAASAASAASLSERFDEGTMELMRDPDRRAEMSSLLDAAAVEKLEKKLAEKADHVESRLRLLNHYRQDRTPEGRAALLRHSLWVLENAPESNTAVRLMMVSKSREPEVHAKMSELWAKHLETSPQSAKIAANAARFFGAEDPARGEALLKKAQELEPKNPAWTQQLGDFYMRTAQSPKAPDPAAARNALAQYEALLALGDHQRKARVLVQAGEAALLAEDAAKAGKFGEALLNEAANADDRVYGAYVHDAHRLLGHAALEAGDTAAARVALAKAAKAPDSMMLERMGPSLTLAKALLEKGEKDAVLAYLDRVAEMWPVGADAVDKWIEQIKNGETPDLDRNKVRIQRPEGQGGVVIMDRPGTAAPAPAQP